MAATAALDSGPQWQVGSAAFTRRPTQRGLLRPSPWSKILQLFAIACKPPETYQRPISHWTPRELADEMIKQGIVESISVRHVARLLEEADLKPHQSRYWLTPPKDDDEFDEKVHDIAQTYLQCD